MIVFPGFIPEFLFEVAIGNDGCRNRNSFTGGKYETDSAGFQYPKLLLKECGRIDMFADCKGDRNIEGIVRIREFCGIPFNK